MVLFNNNRTPKEDEKTLIYWMKLHKSFGVLMSVAIIPRILIRNGSKLPAPLAGPELLQKGGLLVHKG